MTLAVVRAFVPHADNAWKFTLDAIGRYYERCSGPRPRAKHRKLRRLSAR